MMKKLYSLFLLIVLSATTFAQRNADFALVISFLSNNNNNIVGSPVTLNQTVLFDGKTKYYLGWAIANYGPDTLLANDTLYIKSVCGITYKSVFGPKANDTDMVYPLINGVVLNIPPGIIPPLVVTKPWCDSIWIAPGPGNTALIDPDMSNNYYCENITAQYAWAVGINTVSHEEDGFLLYPNPANDKLNLRFDFADAKDVAIVIRNTIGQVVYRHEVGDYSGTWTHTIDIHELPPGMYTAELQYDGHAIISKITIQ